MSNQLGTLLALLLFFVVIPVWIYNDAKKWSSRPMGLLGVFLPGQLVWAFASAALPIVFVPFYVWERRKARLASGTGSATKATRILEPKSVWVAIVLNFFLPGAGYIYAGRRILGAIVLVFGLALGIGVASGSQTSANILGLLAIIGAADGYLTVSKHNKQISHAAASALVACPHCAERIKAEAKVCRFCQRDVVQGLVG